MVSETHTRIKKLSPLLINQLAAGEVVTRPAAVVKELLENAMDANATHIEVRITQGGMGMIEIVDNGDGIHPDDMVMAITRHATSKIADVANLHGISTLGFRGEALAATAAVSRLTLTSSDNDSGIGRQLQVAGVIADEPKLTPVIHNRGTTITVKDLYFNVPARRGNLKSIATEFAHIETVVREVALARADISLTLLHDNKKRLMLSANTNSLNSAMSTTHLLPIARLEQALDLDLSDNTLAVVVDLASLHQHSNGTNPATISGWLWPRTQQEHSLPKLLYVNGRLIKESIITNQLRQLAFNANFNVMGYALYFELPPQWLNINVHPSKQRIKISPLNNILAHLSHNIANQLIKSRNDLDNRLNDKESGDTDTLFLNNPLTHKENVYSAGIKSQPIKQQVKSVTQPYEHSFDKSKSNQTNHFTAKISADALNTKSFIFINHSSDDSRTLNSNAKTIEPTMLAQCLKVIDTLDDYTQPVVKTVGHDTVKLTSNNSNNIPMSWLLFYSQQQLFLIDTQIWYSHFLLLFDNSSSLNLDNFSAATINQKMEFYASQMSSQDLQAYKIDLHKMLSKHALKTITATQLIDFMLN